MFIQVLIFLTSQGNICVIHLFKCFPCLWILFPCLYFDNNWLTLCLFVWLAKNCLCFITKLIYFFKLFPTTFFSSAYVMSLLWLYYGCRSLYCGSDYIILLTLLIASNIITNWLNFCKVFWWFFYADKKHVAILWCDFSFEFVLIISSFYLCK